jgi:hypothetical protein
LGDGVAVYRDGSPVGLRTFEGLGKFMASRKIKVSWARTSDFYIIHFYGVTYWFGESQRGFGLAPEVERERLRGWIVQQLMASMADSQRMTVEG